MSLVNFNILTLSFDLEAVTMACENCLYDKEFPHIKLDWIRYTWDQRSNFIDTAR